MIIKTPPPTPHLYNSPALSAPDFTARLTSSLEEYRSDQIIKNVFKWDKPLILGLGLSIVAGATIGSILKD